MNKDKDKKGDKDANYKLRYYCTLVMLLLALGYIAFLFYSRNVLTDAIISADRNTNVSKAISSAVTSASTATARKHDKPNA